MAELDDASAGDDLLRWCSEVGSGSWSSLRDAAAYVASTRNVRRRPWELAVDLSRLGHVDIDWDGRRWSAAPPCLALSPGMGLCAYLAGWRPQHLIESYRALREDLGMYPFDVAQGSAPTAMFSKFESVQRLQHIAAELNLPVVFDPPSQLAELVGLPTVEALQLASPPPIEETLRLWNASTLDWEVSEQRDLPGLYEFELHGRRAYRLLIGGDWRIVDRATGQLLLVRGSLQPLAWHKPATDMSEPSAFVLPSSISTPQVVDRCLSSASGLLPVTHHGFRIYRNVQHGVAELVAERLGFTLQVRDHPLVAPYGGSSS